ncbi:hypothetical protein FIBSPDRAFT_899136 [Athelia psychrophila]|uniref:GIT Spa2 homology (SHD) domain-containing protein n=1 Tax=Athelia psychrophila TaxID=1759441 RepID=A0A166A4L5_9AGAM|nr:hypothetical protein FIBSPDRAFT_899136 [Fibularhizoctonia sp. CBS 109695]
MKRNPSTPRAPSPTPTAFSGISAYKNDSYRPINGGGKSNNSAPAVPSLDPRIIARTHYDELSRYLAAYLAKAPAGSRSTARAKLTRLTKQQFQELSTDVYDELVRRKKNTDEKEGGWCIIAHIQREAVPFLPVRDDFHPKRNQARQKLATLPTSRFEDLSSDVYYELARRYPEFHEETGEIPAPSPNSAYDDVPSPNFPGSSNSPPPQHQAQLSQSPPPRISDDRDRAPADSGYGGSATARRRPSEDMYGRSGDDSNNPHESPFPRRKASEDQYAPRRSEDAYGGMGRTSEDNERRKNSQDTPPPRRSDERDRRPPSNTDNAGNQGLATSGMIIPNKSTIAEEEIEVPYGRQQAGNRDTVASSALGDDTDGSPKMTLGGLSGLTARLRGASMDDEDERGAGGTRSGGDDYYDKMSLGRTSVGSDRSGAGASVAALRLGGNKGEDTEKIRRDYEYKLATMQSRIAGLERDLGGAADEREARSDMHKQERERGESRAKQGEERVRMMEEELSELRRRAEEQSAAMRTLQRELEDLRTQRSREAEHARDDQAELDVLRAKCERLESGGMLGGGDSDDVDQLRNDMEGLLMELSELSRQNDELMNAKDNDMLTIGDLDSQMKEYKRKYEQAKTELRSVKATSQLFLQAPKSEDQLPVSPDGAILDIHITSFLSGIDSLLTAGRSNAPSRVLTPMKALVNAVAAIVEDVKIFERRPTRNVDRETLKSLRERAEATLTNLVAASKTHATSSGMAPVSLLDAAASHVSATVTEIGRTIGIRKSTKAEQEDFASGFNMGGGPSSAASHGYSPVLRAVDEGKQSPSSSSSHQKKISSASARRMDAFTAPQGALRFAAESRGPSGGSSNSSPMLRDDVRHRLASEPSSSDTNSPPPIFDHPPSRGIVSDDSANAEGSEDAWAELKPYLEAQTESIVYAIQTVLSGVRSPTPSPNLNENLTQIITIVSSIVAVCNDNLPPASAAQGNEILRELSEHANKLSEVQAGEVTKESRQVMAKSSFAVANAMKGLMKL